MLSTGLRGRRRARIGLVALLTGALVFGGGAPTMAAAATPAPDATPPTAATGSISGTVSGGADARPVGGADVLVLDADGTQSAEATTGADGGYTVPGLASGEYYVSVAGAEGYEPAFWPAATALADATTVPVKDGEAAVGIDVTLPAAVVPDAEDTDADASAEKSEAAAPTAPLSGPEKEPSLFVADASSTTYSISGRVTDAAGAPLADVLVSAYGLSARTGADGTYRIEDVSPGSYPVSAWASGYIDQYYGGAAGPNFATMVKVGPDATGIDFALDRAGEVSGRVFDAAGLPAVGATVQLISTETQRTVDSRYVFSGDYYFSKVRPGSYVVLASPASDTSLSETFYPSVATPGDAEIINVEAGTSHSDLDIRLHPGFTISGSVTPVIPDSRNRTIYATSRVDWDGKPYFRGVNGVLNGDGSYRVRGLREGEWLVGTRFADVDYNGYSGYFDGVTVDEADVSGIDFEAFPDGVIEGTIGAAPAAPYKSTLITAYEWTGSTWDQTLSVTGWGKYSLGMYMSGYSYGLPGGTYTVGFSDPSDAPAGIGGSDDDIDYPYCPQFWNAKSTLETADRFQVGPGVTGGIDATLKLKSEGCDGAAQIVPGAPTIIGTAQVGQTLTAVPGEWQPAPVELAYQWYAGETPISGATSQTFVPTAAEVGKPLTVTVTGSRPGYESKQATTPATDPVTGAALTPGTASITGEPRSGSVLTAQPGTWAPDGVSFAYQWSAGGSPIAGATGKTFVPGEPEVGKTVTVAVTGTKTGYEPASVTSASVGPVEAAVLPDLTAGTPRIDGTPRVGETLTLDPGTWGPAPVQLSYSWYVDDVLVPGVDGTTFTPGPEAVGKTVSATVRGSKPGYEPATRTVEGPAVVAPGLIVTGTVAITGDPRVGAELTAAPGSWIPAGVTLGYQWKADGKPIAGADGDTFTATAEQLGAEITVAVTGSAPGYTPASVESEPVGPIAEGVLTPGTVTISGTPLAGQPLTVDPGIWGPGSVSLSFQWSADGTEIAGATDADYTPTADDVGKRLTVAVTGSKPGFASATRTGEASGAVAPSIRVDNASPLPGTLVTVSGEGFVPGERVRLELHSTPVALGEATVDADGKFSALVTIPLATQPGAHTIKAFGESGRAAEAGITVGGGQPSGTGNGTSTGGTVSPGSEGDSGTLAATGGTLPAAVGMLGVLLIVMGAATGVISSRRPLRIRREG